MEKLSRKEAQVLEQIALGYSTKEVAEMFHTSVWTVTNQVRSIYDKTGVTRSFQAITAWYYCTTFDLKDKDGNPLKDKISKNLFDKDKLR